ncbi:hypothetical protein ACTXJG_08355 [Glutamicibacter arilaitensis]|uniref:hypothetical protein n=1 Tax=Glutamicibacter arilaitensis TaxID=256701 RepID=UPI003FD51EB1
MSAATFRVTSLSDSDSVELLSKEEVISRFAPHLSDTTDTETAKTAEKWLKAFLETEVFQVASGVQVTAVSPVEILETASVEYKKLAAEAKTAKAALAVSLLQVLQGVTEKEVAKGKHLPKASGSKTLVSTVESYVITGAGVPKAILKDHKATLPAHVVADLEAIYEQRAAEMKAKTGK